MSSLPSRPAAPVLAGAMNFRDLGGYHTGDGRRIRSGLVFRSNSLQELTPEDTDLLARQLRIASVLDLRSPREAACDGHGPLVKEAVRYVNIPIRPDADDRAAPGYLNSPLPQRYYGYLHRAPEQFVEVLETIAADGALPLVFHCSAGKDRTGVVAALLLGCLGVDSETVVSDYAVTRHAYEEIAAFLRRRRSYARLVDQMMPDALGSEPETMREFLRLLDERHGGARSWARAAGLSEATLARLEATLLEPSE